MGKFLQTMSDLGYALKEEQHLKLTYSKDGRYGESILIVNIAEKNVSYIYVPGSLLLYETDISRVVEEFNVLKHDAEKIAELSKYSLLN